ncbi:MAG: OOP family OmpA-OmpF porin, partial [Saprospiraceae bacterium]
MKKLIFIFIICLVYAISPVQAQDGNARNGVSYSLIKMDYYSPFVDDFSLDNGNITSGAMISYHRNLVKNYLNLEVPVRIGGVKIFDTPNTVARQKGIFGMDALLQLQYNTGSNILVPYLSAGLGGGHINDDGAYFEVPAGVGLDFKIRDGFYFRARGEYRLSFEDNRDSWNYILGLKAVLGGNAKEDKPIEIVPTDRDGDGIIDTNDKCPDVPGLAVLDGCPDKDEDGVADGDDECPDVAGLSKFAGCPDSDSDGIIDG